MKPKMHTDLVKAWEANQQAGWDIADALMALRDDPRDQAASNALDAIDRARRGHNSSNAILLPIQQRLADTLNPTAK